MSNNTNVCYRFRRNDCVNRIPKFHLTIIIVDLKRAVYRLFADCLVVIIFTQQDATPACIVSELQTYNIANCVRSQ